MQASDELKSTYNSLSEIPYFELIKTKDWFERRIPILERDKHKCTICGKVPTMAHYDDKSRKKFELWFIEAEPIYIESLGIHVESEFPEVKVADRKYSLHVHHKLYILERLPWEYNDEELITLCNWCHWDLHLNEIIPVYRTSIDQTLEQIEVTPCHRCHGAGWFPEYTHVQSGECFRWKGNRYEQLIR